MAGQHHNIISKSQNSSLVPEIGSVCEKWNHVFGCNSDPYTVHEHSLLLSFSSNLLTRLWHRILWKSRIDGTDIYQRSMLVSYRACQISARCQLGFKMDSGREQNEQGIIKERIKWLSFLHWVGDKLAFIFLFVLPCAERRTGGRLVIDVRMVFVPFFVLMQWNQSRKAAIICWYTVQKEGGEEKREHLI